MKMRYNYMNNVYVFYTCNLWVFSQTRKIVLVPLVLYAAFCKDLAEGKFEHEH